MDETMGRSRRHRLQAAGSAAISRLLRTGKCRQSTSASLFARLRRLATEEAYQRVPRAGRMPRSLSALVIASSVVAPVLRIASMIGRRPDANWSAAAVWICRPHTPAAAISKGCPARRHWPSSPPAPPWSFRDQTSFFFGQRRVEVQHERIGIAAQLGNDERHALRHQTGHERDVAGEPVELGHQDAAFGGPRCSQCRGKLGPAIERIGALAGLGLDELADDRDPLGFAEAGNGSALSIDPSPERCCCYVETRSRRRCIAHTNCIPPFAVCMRAAYPAELLEARRAPARQYGRDDRPLPVLVLCVCSRAHCA